MRARHFETEMCIDFDKKGEERHTVASSSTAMRRLRTAFSAAKSAMQGGVITSDYESTHIRNKNPPFFYFRLCLSCASSGEIDLATDVLGVLHHLEAEVLHLLAEGRLHLEELLHLEQLLAIHLRGGCDALQEALALKGKNEAEMK